MNFDDVLKSIISAVIALVVPAALKGFLPEGEKDSTLPWLKWLVAGFVGGALGGLASGLFSLMGLSAANPSVTTLLSTGLGNWAVFGVALGSLQWIALRGYRPVGTWFIFASMLGWMLFVLGGAWGWIVSGIAIGLLQYLALTKWQGAFWWIIANAIAWLIAGWAGIIVGTLILAANPILAWIVGWGVVGLVGAIILLAPLGQLKAKT